MLNLLFTKNDETKRIMEPKETKISDYLYILYKWRKLLFINLGIIFVVSLTIVLLLPNQYKATATIMIPPDNQSALGGLTSLLGGKSSLASLGSRVFGVSGTSEDVVLGLINSRTALTNVIKKFNLMEYYEIDDNMDKAIKAFKRDLLTNPNEYGMIEFSIVNKSPEVSAEIANYLVAMVDSMNIQYNIQRAKSNRIFIEQRYLQNLADLRNAEDSLFRFQTKYGIVSVPDQLEVTIKIAAEIESQLFKKEMEGYFAQQLYGENSPQYQRILNEQKLLKSKIAELKSSQTLGATSNILHPFKNMPEMSIQYLRTYRDVEIQQAILEFIMPLYEQAKVEEQKSIPTIMVIDEAIAPLLKHSPKRATFVLGILFLFTFLLIPFIFIAEKAVSRVEYKNPLQVKESNFFYKVKKTYRIKV
jgi:tyrosine-protein kinase Etk/Wzc